MTKPILLIDDDPSIRKTVEILLGIAHMKVKTVDSGEAGIQVLRDGFKGLILLDIMMPGLDGWQTLEKMIQDDLIEGSVVCMLTAVQTPEDPMDPLKEYVLDYIRKPFTQSDLVIGVQSMLDYLP